MAHLRYAAVRREAHLPHAVQHAAVRGLQAVADVGQRSPDDYAHRVIHVRALHLVFDVDGDAVRGSVQFMKSVDVGSGAADAYVQGEAGPAGLHVEVSDVERVVLDELAPRLDLVAHQRGEHLVRLGVVLGADLQQRPVLGIHRRGPQRVRVHLAETLVAVDGDALLAGGDEEVDERVDVLPASRPAPLARPRAGTRDGFGSAASLVASSSGAPPMAVSSAAAVTVLGRRRLPLRRVALTTTGNLMSWISRYAASSVRYSPEVMKSTPML